MDGRELLTEISQYLPFISAAMRGPNSEPPKHGAQLTARVLEMALMLGFAYGVVSKDIEQLKTSIARLESQVAEIRHDIYRPQITQGRP